MRRRTSATVFVSTNGQVVLSFMADHPEGNFLPGDIQEATDLSKAGTHRALKALEDQGLVTSESRGRMSFYSLRAEDARVRQFKALKTVIMLEPHIEKLKPFVRKVILFGSAARGEDGPGSDLDLFIAAKDVDEARRKVDGWKLKRKLQPVIKTAVDVASMEKGEAVFMREVENGIVLWEGKDDA